MASTAAITERKVVSRACNVEDIYQDFEARRAGLLKALTNDIVEFYMQCSPHKEELRLYGLPNRSWELKVPDENCELHDIPAPITGINLVRPNNMQDGNWIPLIAIHSDSWLIVVAFYYASKSGFDLADRDKLYHMINDVPTLAELVGRKNLKNKETSSKGPKIKS